MNVEPSVCEVFNNLPLQVLISFAKLNSLSTVKKRDLKKCKKKMMGNNKMQKQHLESTWRAKKYSKTERRQEWEQIELFK